MTYKELNEKLFDAFEDSKGNVEGRAVELIYEINKIAVVAGANAEVNQTELNVLLKSFGLYKVFFKSKS